MTKIIARESIPRVCASKRLLPSQNKNSLRRTVLADFLMNFPHWPLICWKSLTLLLAKFDRIFLIVCATPDESVEFYWVFPLLLHVHNKGCASFQIHCLRLIETLIALARMLGIKRRTVDDVALEFQREEIQASNTSMLTRNILSKLIIFIEEKYILFLQEMR